MPTPEVIKPITKLFIAQRGEIAVRALETCEKRLARGEQIQVVVPYTFSDLNPIASRMVTQHAADGWEIMPMPGINQEQNYANVRRLIMAARSHSCNYIFLGYGFKSEDADAVERFRQAGLQTVTPNPQAMRLTGNKLKATEIAKSVRIGRLARIPVIEGSGNLASFEEAVRAADRYQYPVMLKDPDLGGGKGNKPVKDKVQLEAAYKELKSRPSNRELFLQRYLPNAIHLEVQIIADQYGHRVSLGVRNCSTQRASQKLIEEQPAGISSRLSRFLQTAAVNIMNAVGYDSAGTVEFIGDQDKRDRYGDPLCYFLEINPRIQVEHRVTEAVTGIDIVDVMMGSAEGRVLPFTQDQVTQTGHGIQMRIYAEDPLRNFEMTPGKVAVLRYPKKEGVRVAPALEEGDSLSPWFDHTLMIVVAHSSTREATRRKLVDFGHEIEIFGLSNNRTFVLDLLNSDRFRNNTINTTYTETFQREIVRQRIQSAGIINSGTASIQEPSSKFDPTCLPQDTTIIPAEIDGQENKEKRSISYSEYLKKTQEKTTKTSAADYYIIERDGVRYVLYDLDYRVAGGSVGVQEGSVFEDACKLANKNNLPLVVISRSGGANQWQNNLALFQMGRTVAALEKYPPKLVINIYAGMVYGGVPASFAGVADVQMTVDAPGAYTGFSGGFIVAKDSGKNPAGFKPADAYAVLSEGTHTPIKHFQDRNTDILVSSLEEAGDIISHLIRINRTALKSAIVNPNFPFQPKQGLAYREMFGRALRHDRSDRRFPVWIGNFGGFLEKYIPDHAARTDSSEPLTIAQKIEILNRGDRPTTADLLDPMLGLFDDTRFLTSPPFEFPGIQQYPRIIAACANLGPYDLFVLGQQTHRVFDEDRKVWLKRYEGQRPEDWEYTLHMLEVARKLGLPLVLFGDTNGADCSPESESRNQSHKIARVIAEINRYPYVAISGNIGLKGSGGGETFIRPLDFAFDAGNALGFVATPMVQYWIISDKWIHGSSSDEEKAELTWFINQLNDATAEGRLQLKMIDTIVKEGPGGAHLNPQLFARGIRRELLQALPPLLTLSQEDLLKRRWERIEAVNNYVSVPLR